MSKLTYEKLGIKEEFRCVALFSPGNYMKLVSSPFPVIELNAFDDVHKFSDPLDFIHVFTNEQSEVEDGIQLLKNSISQNGMIWFSWFKKSSKKQKTVSEDVIRGTALASGLVDVKVCSINEDWSALKLVIPLKLRK